VQKKLLLLTMTLITACGGGGHGTAPAPATTTTLSGVVFASAPFNSGNVYLYDFSSGSKGTLLRSTPINTDGSYSTSLTVPPTHVLVEATGCYNETVYWFTGAQAQAPGVVSTANPVCINAGLDAVVAVGTGTMTANVTPLTHASYGLVQYNLQHGIATAAAVADGNSRLSLLAGFDIVQTTPIYPTQNATASVGTQYGGLLSGIASWLYNVAYVQQTGTVLSVGAPGLATLNIAEAMRNDLANDGVLDGIGSDTFGNPYSLKIANTPLSTTVYRHQFAKYAVIALRGAFEDHFNATISDMTRIDGYLLALAAYNNTNVLYDNSALIALDEGGPIVGIASPTANATLTGSAGIDGTIKDITGVVDGNSEFLIDGAHYDYFLDPLHPNHFINTTVFPNGVHTLTIKATNNLGTTNTKSVSVTFSN